MFLTGGIFWASEKFISSRGVPESEDGTRRLTYHWIARSFCVLAIAVFAIPPVFGAPHPLFFVLIISVIIVFLIDALIYEIRYGPEGISVRSLWRGRRFIAWREVKKVTRNWGDSRLVKTSVGSVYVPHYFMRGSEEFLESAKRFSKKARREKKPRPPKYRWKEQPKDD